MARLIQIAGVWLGCALAWLILGSTLMSRSGGFSDELTPEVYRLWGPPLEQHPPTAQFTEIQNHREMTTVVDTQGISHQSTVEKEDRIEVPIPIAGSKIQAQLQIEYRRKGLLWFSTYGVDFSGDYTFVNRSGAARDVSVFFPIDKQNVGLDGFSVRDSNGKEVTWTVGPEGASWPVYMKVGETVRFVIAYHSRGTGSWQYAVTNGGGQARDFHLSMQTNFANVDFPAGTLSPSSGGVTDSGWKGEWNFSSLITSAAIGVELPHKLNPGPLAARITYFAPVSLLFFFFVITLLGEVQDRRFHPAHYFFLGCAFFSFHLLVAYLADHLTLPWVFGIASGVSLALVVSYARLFAGWTFAWREMGIAQLIYLVLFSLTFMLEGFTGLAITCGAVATLFVMMQVTGRKRTAVSTSA
jgi:hypothetical protein